MIVTWGSAAKELLQVISGPNPNPTSNSTLNSTLTLILILTLIPTGARCIRGRPPADPVAAALRGQDAAAPEPGQGQGQVQCDAEAE